MTALEAGKAMPKGKPHEQRHAPGSSSSPGTRKRPRRWSPGARRAARSDRRRPAALAERAEAHKADTLAEYGGAVEALAEATTKLTEADALVCNGRASREPASRCAG